MRPIRRVLFGEARSVRDRKGLPQPFAGRVPGLGRPGRGRAVVVVVRPDEAFSALGATPYLAVGLALATALTVFIISVRVQPIIEHFPFGGGGYVVATQAARARTPASSPARALLVDYVLTITTSIAAGADAVFSFCPPGWRRSRLSTEFAVIVILRPHEPARRQGVGDDPGADLPGSSSSPTRCSCSAASVHRRATNCRGVARGADGLRPSGSRDARASRACSASSCARTRWARHVHRHRGRLERPARSCASRRCETGKRTMILHGRLAGGHRRRHHARLPALRRDAVGRQDDERRARRALRGRLARSGALPVGHWFVIVTLCAEALLLFVAAQTGFIDGPRVMANMAIDSWLPHRFAAALRPADDAERRAPDGRRVASRRSSTPAATSPRWWSCTRSTCSSPSRSRSWRCAATGIAKRQKHRTGRSTSSSTWWAWCSASPSWSSTSSRSSAEGGWVTWSSPARSSRCAFSFAGTTAKRAEETSAGLDEILPIWLPAPLARPLQLSESAPTAVLLVGATRAWASTRCCRSSGSSPTTSRTSSSSRWA